MKRILVLEDEYFQANESARVVEAAGFGVVGPFGLDCEIPEERLQEVDGAVLDINLGGELVFPLLDRLCAYGVPVALLTGYDTTFIPLRFAGVPVFIKPENCAKAVASVAERLEPPGE